MSIWERGREYLHPSMSVVHELGHFSVEGRLVSPGPEPPEKHREGGGMDAYEGKFLCVHTCPQALESL